MKVTWRSRQTAVIHGTVRSWSDRGHSCHGVAVTTFIHDTELIWPHSFMIRSWCDRVKPWYGVDVIAFIPGTASMRFGMRWCDSAKSLNVVSVYTVHCTVGFICAQKSANSSYGVKKISIKWLWTVTVTSVHCKKKFSDFPSPAGMSLTKLSLARSWSDRGLSCHGVDVTTFIHDTELMWPRKAMVWSLM